jgi:hypothetical protein
MCQRNFVIRRQTKRAPGHFALFSLNQFSPNVTFMSPLLHVLLAFILLAGSARALSEKELETIGRKVWQNECGGTRDGLTSWNAGEDFASLGIGHFIWYPKGMDGPFEESFPKLVSFLSSKGARLPAWLKPDLGCPWKSKAEFQADFRSDRMNEMRDLLATTVPLQSQFLALRMHEALPKMLQLATAEEKGRVKENFERLAASGPGTFALIDYVNFKGEGTKLEERYHGEGWGLLQVLSNMRPSGTPVEAFAESAAEVLTKRVKNSPPARGEQRWLPGWKSRVRAYAS